MNKERERARDRESEKERWGRSKREESGIRVSLRQRQILQFKCENLICS